MAPPYRYLRDVIRIAINPIKRSAGAPDRITAASSHGTDDSQWVRCCRTCVGRSIGYYSQTLRCRLIHNALRPQKEHTRTAAVCTDPENLEIDVRFFVQLRWGHSIHLPALEHLLWILQSILTV